MSQELTLRVVEPKARDLNRKIARLSDYAMRQLDIKPGDYIEIIGPRASVPAQAMLTEGIAYDEIRIDGNTWKYIGVNVGDEVKVRKATVKPAIRIVLAPIKQALSFYYSSFLNFIKYDSSLEFIKYNYLMNKPLTKGETISIPAVGGSINIVVVETISLGISV